MSKQKIIICLLILSLILPFITNKDNIINNLTSRIQTIEENTINNFNCWRITVFHSHPTQSENYSTFCVVDKNGNLVLDFFYSKLFDRHYSYLSGNKDSLNVRLWSGNTVTIILKNEYTLYFINTQYNNWDIRFTVTNCIFENK